MLIFFMFWEKILSHFDGHSKDATKPDYKGGGRIIQVAVCPNV